MNDAYPHVRVSTHHRSRQCAAASPCHVSWSSALVQIVYYRWSTRIECVSETSASMLCCVSLVGSRAHIYCRENGFWSRHHFYWWALDRDVPRRGHGWGTGKPHQVPYTAATDESRWYFSVWCFDFLCCKWTVLNLYGVCSCDRSGFLCICMSCVCFTYTFDLSSWLPFSFFQLLSVSRPVAFGLPYVLFWLFSMLMPMYYLANFNLRRHSWIL